MKQLTCEMCGSTELLKQDGVFVCQNCGTKYSVEEAKKMMIEGTVQVSNIANVKSLIDRGNLSLEEYDWESANNFFDRVLDIEPRNASAYIGKLCAELMVKNEIELIEKDICLDGFKNYQRALQFGRPDLQKKVEEHRNRKKETMVKALKEVFGEWFIDQDVQDSFDEKNLNTPKVYLDDDFKIFIQFGGIKWRVLTLQNKKALLLSDKIIEKRKYKRTSTIVTWETSSLREYLNSEFLNRFSIKERGMISKTKVKNSNNPWYKSSGGNDTYDKIFILSIEEVVEYFGNSGLLEQCPKSISNLSMDIYQGDWVEDGNLSDIYNSNRKALDNTNEYSTWWLRSPGLSVRPNEETGNVVYIDESGIIHFAGYNSAFGSMDQVIEKFGCGIRPALWLNIDANIDDYENDIDYNCETSEMENTSQINNRTSQNNFGGDDEDIKKECQTQDGTGARTEPSTQESSTNNKAGEKSKKKIGIICLFSVVVIIALIIVYNTSTGNKNTIVGTWQWVDNPSSQVIYTDDGKCIITGQSGDSINTYSISGNKITINFDGVNPISETYTFSIKGDKLIVGPDTYTRVK